MEFPTHFKIVSGLLLTLISAFLIFEVTALIFCYNATLSPPRTIGNHICLFQIKVTFLPGDLYNFLRL
jgi:hypothetical protein